MDDDDLLRSLGREQRNDLDTPHRHAVEHDELSRPFDDGERADILDAVFERVDASEASGPDRDGVEVSAEDSNGAEVIELGSRRRVVVLSALVAAAAALALWWVLPPSGAELELVASVPDYSFRQVHGGIAEQRSHPVEPTAGTPELTLARNSDIVWVLTPAESTRETIGLALVAHADSGATIFVPQIDAELSEQGALRVRGRLSQHVQLEPGRWTLTLLVAKLDELPTNEAAAAAAGPWRSLVVRVTITADD